MAACIPKDVVESLLREIAKKEEIKRARNARINIWNVTDDMVDTMLDKGHIGLIPEEVLDSQPIRSKLNSNLKYTRETTKAFINKLRENKTEGPEAAGAARLRAIGLHTVLEQLKGEVDKANSRDIELGTISEDGGATPYLPLHRLAATIGRKVLYLKGYTVTKYDKSTAAAEEVEAINYDFGMKVINELQDQGFIKVHEKAPTIKDYRETLNDTDTYGSEDSVVEDNPAISINLAAFNIEQGSGTKKASKANQEALKYFTDRPNANLKNHPLGEYIQVLNAINLLSQPNYISLPGTEKSSTPGKHFDDVYKRDPDMEQATADVASQPVHINDALHDFYDMLAEYNESGTESASTILKDLLVGQKHLIAGLFKQDIDRRAVSQRESVKGRNLSSATPLDDLVEYWGEFKGKMKDIFLDFFAGRNGRMYYDNSVLNGQTSKLMRHTMAVAEYEMKTGSKEYNFFVGKVAHTLNMSPDEIFGTGVETQKSLALTSALKEFNKFVQGKNLNDKVAALSKMTKVAPTMDYADLVTTLQAVSEIRGSVGKASVKTTYMASSDATASGGMLTLLQALGSSPEVTELLQEMGIIKGKKKSLPDVYAILKKQLDNYIEFETIEGVDITPTGPEGKARAVMKMTSKVLFKDIRDMAKKPTMTFIYGQSRGGAEVGISEDMTDRVMDQLKAGNLEVIGIINEVMSEHLDTPYPKTQASIDALLKDPKLTRTLVADFKATGMPGFMYDVLKAAVTNKYLDKWQKRGTAIFNLIKRYPKMAQMKVLPASAALHFTKPASETQLDKYGVPLQKIVEVRHDTYNAPVLTREGDLTQTIMNVSQIHTADTAAAYRSLKGLPQKHNAGVVVVHDDIRSSVPLVMEAEQNYINEVHNLASNYDIHEQVLLAAAQYDPDIESDPDWIKLKTEVEAAKAARQEALKEFNFETDTIIGDKLPEVNVPTGPAVKTVKTDTAATTDATAEPKVSEKAAKAETPTGGLETLAGDSEIISQFLASSNKAKVTREGDAAKFDPRADVISIPENVSKEEAIEMAEHEIVHSYTAGLIQKYYQEGGSAKLDPFFDHQSKLNIAYVEKALKKLQKIAGSKVQDLDPKVAKTVWKIASEDTPTGVAELIAVLSAEPTTAKAIYEMLGEGGSKSKLATVIEHLVARVRKMFREVGPADLLEINDVDVQLLYSSVNQAIAVGKSMREQQIDTTLELQKGFGDLYHGTDFGQTQSDRFTVTSYIDSANDAVARKLNDPALRKSGQLAVQTDRFLKTHFPAYRIARDKIAGLYESHGELQQLVHTLSNANIDKEKKNTILSAFSKIRSEKNEVTSVELGKFTSETSKLNAEQKKAFYDFTHRMPVHDFFLEVEKDNVSDFKAYAEGLATEFSKDQVRALDAIVDMRVHDKTTSDTKYSVNQIFAPNSKFGKNARKYIVAKTITEIGQDKWNEFAGNEGLFQLTRDASLANAVLNAKQENQKLGDTLVRDEPKNPLYVRAVKKEDMWKYSDEEKSGWTVYQSPEGSKPGLVYRRIVDQTFMEGAFTDAKYHSSDIDVDENMRGMDGVVKSADGYKLMLTTKQKQDMGIFNDAEQGLVRSLTHAMAIQDSQNIRDQLLQRETYRNMDTTKQQEVIDLINDKESDHPWFLGGKVPYEELDVRIRNKYKPVHGRMSDVEGYNDKVKYVRKDIEHWLIGRTERSLFNDPKLQWATRITKNLVAGAKIGMVILNPMKIVADNVSNLAYLGVRGVDPLYAQKQYRVISKEFHDYQQMKNQLNHLRVKGYSAGENSSTKKRIAQLEEDLKKHPANGLVERGFINSLGSDLVLRSGDPSAGLKADMDAVLKVLFKSKNGDNNKAGQLLMKLANWNIGLDQFLEIFAKIPGATDSTQNIEKELLTISKRLKEIKTQDDAVSYLHQYLNSPDSEFVKMGTYMTDLTDVLAKETFYRFLTDRGMDPKKAEIEVIDSFPDYKENLPTRVKQLSDVGILMFPSYWLRIQKAIYRMVKDRPVNFATEMSIEAAMGIDAPQIWDANIYSKATSNYGLLHTPWEHIGKQSFFPVHAL